MALQGLIFTLGVILAVVGGVKRGTTRGKWLLAAGMAVMFAAILLVGYTDIKMGVFDALND